MTVKVNICQSGIRKKWGVFELIMKSFYKLNWVSKYKRRYKIWKLTIKERKEKVKVLHFKVFRLKSSNSVNKSYIFLAFGVILRVTVKFSSQSFWRSDSFLWRLLFKESVTTIGIIQELRVWKIYKLKFGQIWPRKRERKWAKSCW